MVMFAIVLAIISFILFRYFYAGITSIKASNQELLHRVSELNNQLDVISAKESKARHDAERAFDAKEKLLAALSHEIRTPMNGVIGMANLLVETDLNAEQKEYANTVLECSTSLLSNVNEILINDMLDFSKIDTLNDQLEDMHFDVHHCVEEVLDIFATRAAEKGIELLYQVSKNVPLQIDTDYKKLQKVLINLVDNSLDNTDSGEIVILVDARENEQGNKMLIEFRVTDSGNGIPAEKIKDIFKGTISQSAGEDGQQKGFGLVICKRIMNQLDGDISVINNAEAGSTFTIQFPTNITHSTSLGFIDNRLKDIEGKQVLIVSANRKSGQLLSARLERWKLLPVFAGNLADAKDVLKQVTIDVLLIDSLQVDTDGIAVTEALHELHPDIPAILMNTSTDDRYKQFTDYFSSVISKPLKYNNLLDSLISSLRVTTARAGANVIPADFAVKFPLKIIVAEDNPVNQKWIVKILGKIGYDCELAENGNVVMDKVSHEKFDLILMDVQMPGMDGLEATRMIRLCLETQPVIVAMTANAMQGDREKCLESGMNDYIAKPVELPVLLSMLEKWAIFIRDKKEDTLEKFNA